MEEMLRSEKLEFTYTIEEEDGTVAEAMYALQGVDISVQKGEFVVILGHNGSGKSTFARHINALLEPSGGTLWIQGMNTKEEDKIWLIRQKDGMIFQNPDNQMIASVVEEDVAFGPENLGMQPERIRASVKEALEAGKKIDFHTYKIERQPFL